MIEFVNKYDGINYADKIAAEYAQKAIDNIKPFEGSEAYNSLISLVSFVVERKN